LRLGKTARTTRTRAWAVSGALVCDVAVNNGQGVPGDLPDELLELSVGSVPFFDLGDQIHRHIDRAGLGLDFESQMPAWSGTAGPLEGAERAFQERADLAEPAQGDLAAGAVPIGGHGVMLHIGSIKAY